MGINELLLVCEGPTDAHVFEALAEHYSNNEVQIKITTLAPRYDATSGSYESFGFGSVLNWCKFNKNKVEKMLAFAGARALLVQMDTDIADNAMLQMDLKLDEHVNKNARERSEISITKAFGTKPDNCYYVLPTQNTETWLLAANNTCSILDINNWSPLKNYEKITDTERWLIQLGYPSKKGKSAASERKLNKHPAKRYKTFGKELVDNLSIAKTRCVELDSLCNILSSYAR
jgi:hypothetical protein